MHILKPNIIEWRKEKKDKEKVGREGIGSGKMGVKKRKWRNEELNIYRYNNPVILFEVL